MVDISIVSLDYNAHPIRTFGISSLSGASALAEKRVALVIGNSAYEGVSALTNPANDAAAITATLKSAGFDIIDSPHAGPLGGPSAARQADKRPETGSVCVFSPGGRGPSGPDREATRRHRQRKTV